MNSIEIIKQTLAQQPVYPNANRRILESMALLAVLILSACAGDAGRTAVSGKSCEICGYQQTAVTDDIFFLEYVHTSKGARHEAAINAVKDRGQQVCVEKGFTQSRFAQQEILNLMNVSSPHRDNFVEMYQGHAKASAHILCTGSATQLQHAGVYLMKCNADTHCESVDADVKFPLQADENAVEFDFAFRSLADRNGSDYEHSVVVLADESIQHQSSQVIPGPRSFSIDFKFTEDGLVKNIQPASDGLTMPHGQLGSFQGWIVARASNATGSWFYISYQPSVNAQRLRVAVKRLSNEAYNEFREQDGN